MEKGGRARDGIKSQENTKVTEITHKMQKVLLPFCVGFCRYTIGEKY